MKTCTFRDCVNASGLCGLGVVMIIIVTVAFFYAVMCSRLSP